MRNHFLRAGGIPSSGSTDPYVEGKFHYYKSDAVINGETRDAGGFGAFWDTGSGTEDLQINPDGDAAAFYEKDTTTHTSHADEWTSFQIDLSSVTSPGRLVFYARRATSGDYLNDFAFDSIKLNTGNGSVVDFSTNVAATLSNDLWYRTPDTSYYTNSISDYASAKSTYDRSVLEDIEDSESSTVKRFNLENLTTSSSYTGPDKASSNSDTDLYIYFEASGGGTGESGGSYVAWQHRYNLTTGATV